jgi:hypothetical protein
MGGSHRSVVEEEGEGSEEESSRRAQEKGMLSGRARELLKMQHADRRHTLANETYK